MGFKEELLAELKQGTREPEEENSKNKKATNSEIIKYAAAYKSKDRKSSGKKTQTKSEKTENREKAPRESITRGFDASQKQYDDYVKSGTHRENQKNALDRAMEMIFSSGSSAADAPATLFRADDIQEQQLRAQKDYYQGQVDAEENAKILAPRLEEIRAMPEEDRQALEQYVAGRADDFYKALDPAYNGGLAADVTRSADFQAYDLYQKYGVAKVRELAEALEWEQSQKAAEEAAAQGQQAASGGALGTVGANLGTIPANIVGAITAPLGYARELTTRTGDLATLNPYNEGTWVNAWSGNVRDTTARNIEGGIGGVGGQVASMGYQGLMSAADSLARIAFTGGNAAASLGLAATGSFGQTLQEVSQRGGSPAQAVLQATANASFEVLTEKLPLDNLLDMAKAGKKPMAQTVMNILGQAGIEAGTEEVNFVAQLLTEAAILREKSGYNTQVNDLVANGMSYADAKAQASKALWDEALQIAGVSGFSGVLSAGGASAYSYVTGPQASQAPEAQQPQADQTDQTANPEQDVLEPTPEEAVQAQTQVQPQLDEAQPTPDEQAEPGESQLPSAETQQPITETAQTPQGQQAEMDEEAEQHRQQLKEDFLFHITSATTNGLISGQAEIGGYDCILSTTRSGRISYSVRRKRTGEVLLSDSTMYSDVNDVAKNILDYVEALGAIDAEMYEWNARRTSPVNRPATQAPSLSQQVTKDAAETLTTNMDQESQQNTESQGPAKEKPLPKTELDAIREAANMPQEPAAQTVEPDLQKAIDMTIPPDAGSASKPEQLNNVDNAPQMAYNENKKFTGGARNGGTAEGTDRTAATAGAAQAQDSGRGVSGRPVYYSGKQKAGADGRTDSGVAGSGRVSKSTAKAMKAKGIVNTGVKYADDDGAFFSASMTAAMVTQPHGAAVDVKTADDLTKIVQEGGHILLAPDGSAGAVITKDGDIEAVFKNRRAGNKDSFTNIMLSAIENGGRKLDCYGLQLANKYAQFGFTPVARTKFNREYANPNWNYALQGEPDIYTMMYTGKGAEDTLNNKASAKQYTQEELDALPVMEYDDALAYRNSLLDQQQTGSVGAAKRDFAGTADYDNLLSDTNAQRNRPGDVRPVEVPKVDAQGKQVSEFVGNAYGAEVTPDSFIPTIRQLVMRGKVSHDVLSNEQALRDAAEEVSRRGIVSALETVRNTARRGKVSAHDVAMAELIYNYTVNSGDNLSQQMAADAFTSLAEMATSGGRAVQLYGMMKKMTPEGMVYSLQADIDRTVRRLEAQGKIKLKGEDLSKLPDDVKALYKEAARNLRNAKTPEKISDAEAELKAVTEQAYCAIASRLEATAKDRWDAWRYMSMLFNVKTQVRNLGGNAAMMPYTSAKRVVNSAMQSMFIRDKSKRTAAVLTPADHALVRWARADAKSDAVRKLLDGTEKAGGEAESEIEKRRRVFKPDVLEKIRKLSHDIPSGADLLFKNGEYSRSLASALKAKGYSLADVQAGSVPSDVMEQCRTLAINEALRATFNDSNALSDFVSGLKIHNPDNAVKKFANVLVEGLIPFKRTPANVAVRAIEYSPAGLVRGIWNAAFDVHRGKITAAQAIDRISGGLVGTGVYVLGCFMAKGLFGVKLTGKLDDEDEKRRGRQEYSLEFSIDGQEYSYSINWLAPANIPLFMGVNTYQAWQESGEEPSISTLTAVLQGVGYAFEPMLSMSFMSGVNSLVDSVRYSEDGRQVYAIAATLATNYFTQGIPALAKQTYQAANSDTKTTYADSEDPLIQDAQYVIGKVPVLGDLAGVKVDKVNAWGETETEDNPLSRAFNAFFNPGTLKEIDDRPIEKEISRLNSLVSEGVSPPTVKKNVSYTDTSGQMQERRLTADEYTQMQKIQGTVRKTILSGLIQDKSYQKLTPTQQAQAVKLAYDIAAERAKSSVLDDYYSQASSWLRDIADNNWTGAAPQIVQKVTQDSLNEAIKSLTDAYKSGFDPTQDEERLSASYDAYSKMDARTKRTVREAVDTDTRRYLQARGAGLSQDRYIGIVQDIKGLEPWEGRTKVSDSQTMEAIADAGLSQDQTVAVMKMYMDTNDYADERLDWFIDKGMDPGEFADAWAAYQMESSTGKGQADRTRERYREMGYTHAEAAYLYKLFSGREKPWEE